MAFEKSSHTLKAGLFYSDKDGKVGGKGLSFSAVLCRWPSKKSFHTLEAGLFYSNEDGGGMGKGLSFSAVL